MPTELWQINWLQAEKKVEVQLCLGGIIIDSWQPKFTVATAQQVKDHGNYSFITIHHRYKCAVIIEDRPLKLSYM